MSIAERKQVLRSEIARTRESIASQSGRLREEAGLALFAFAAVRLLAKRFPRIAIASTIASAAYSFLRSRRDS